jgi:hypothetical protein
VSTKKKSRERKKVTRKHSTKKKRLSKRAMALNHQRDPLRQQAQPLGTADQAPDRPLQKKHPITASTAQARIEKNSIMSDSGRADPLTVAEEPAPIVTAFEGQMRLFAMVLRWSPLAILIQQQALAAQMILNMRYPGKSEPT